MCFTDLATVICTTCQRTLGEVATGTSPCEKMCGQLLSRHTGQRVEGECGVCEAKREESARRAAALRKFSLKTNNNGNDKKQSPMEKKKQAVNDGLVALKLAAESSLKRLFRAWILVPLGLMLMLVACFGVDSLFKHVGVSFPASVACLVLLFAGLLLSEWLLGSHRTRRIVSVIDVPAGWSLRWINLFFTPSFVLLPLSPKIGIIEVLKIIAVFVIGFLVMMALAAYLTRFLQLLLGTSKRAQTQQAEELGNETDEIPLAESHPTTTTAYSTPASISQASSPMATQNPTPASSRPQTPPQLRLQDRHYGQTSAPSNIAETLVQPDFPAQNPLPLPRAERWAAVLTAHENTTIYTILFFLVSLPVYYTTGYAMPAHLALNILSYAAAMSIPPSWRTYLHPVLVSSLLTVLLIWALAATTTTSLPSALHEYRTGAKYIQLWRNSQTSHTLPGAADILATLLDASIVSLALPTFQHRRELKAHLIPLLIPTVLISVASLLAYPPLCFVIGIAAERSLAFASRSLTLALATPATENLGGDVNTVAALTIMAGIAGALVGNKILAALRIPADDYVTRGVTLGANSGAIATALLLRTDPRAAAVSCLSMILFGTVTVLFTSIPPVANTIRSFVGL